MPKQRPELLIYVSYRLPYALSLSNRLSGVWEPSTFQAFTGPLSGGESGRGARPIQEEWIDGIHKQCVASGTAFFFKQWGVWGKDSKKRSKKANGREYRGKTWDEMPQPIRSAN